MATTNDDSLSQAVQALLGTPSCSPVVGRKNNCWECEGAGIVGDERKHGRCPSCDGTGLARTLQSLIAERRSLLQEMRAAGDIQAREVLRGQVALLDVEIAELRRSGRAA